MYCPRTWKSTTIATCQLLAVFLTSASAATQPQPIATLSITNAKANEYLGLCTATDGQRVFLGTGIGTAYLFDPFTRQQLAKVTLPNQSWYTSVAIQGKTGVFGGQNVAVAYDFTNLPAITSKSLIPTTGPLSTFIGAVDISGESIIVGANHDSGLGEYAGAAYLFDRVTGVQYAKLTGNDTKARDFFGVSVAIDGNLAVVGSSKMDRSNSAVYLFNAQPGFIGQRQIAEFTVSPPNPNPGQDFGSEVDISGDRIFAIEQSGQAFLWTTSGQPAPLPYSQGFHFEPGHSTTAIDTQFVAVGVPNIGYVNFYDANRNFIRSLYGPANGPIGFGASVAIGGDLLVVSAPGGDPAKSVVYVYRLSDVVVPEPSTVSIVAMGYLLFGSNYRHLRSKRVAGFTK